MENGKLLVFRFSIGVGKRNAAIKSRAETACRLCRDEAVKPEGQLTTNRGQRLLADYAEVRRRKSPRRGVKTENGKLLV